LFLLVSFADNPYVGSMSQLAYDARNRPTSATLSGVSVGFGNDAEGHQQGLTTGGQTTTYIAAQPVRGPDEWKQHHLGRAWPGPAKPIRSKGSPPAPRRRHLVETKVMIKRSQKPKCRD